MRTRAWREGPWPHHGTACHLHPLQQRPDAPPPLLVPPRNLRPRVECAPRRLLLLPRHPLPAPRLRLLPRRCGLVCRLPPPLERVGQRLSLPELNQVSKAPPQIRPPARVRGPRSNRVPGALPLALLRPLLPLVAPPRQVPCHVAPLQKQPAQPRPPLETHEVVRDVVPAALPGRHQAPRVQGHSHCLALCVVVELPRELLLYPRRLPVLCRRQGLVHLGGPRLTRHGEPVPEHQLLPSPVLYFHVRVERPAEASEERALARKGNRRRSPIARDPQGNSAPLRHDLEVLHAVIELLSRFRHLLFRRHVPRLRARIA